jgi:hypothetical protein
MQQSRSKFKTGKAARCTLKGEGHVSWSMMQNCLLKGGCMLGHYIYIAIVHSLFIVFYSLFYSNSPKIVALAPRRIEGVLIHLRKE